jgi:AcrR family transcriptional regulator
VVSRDLVLTTALALLEEGGLEAVTMRALARRLAVDPMAPYHYFPDKDAILHAAAARVYSELRVKVPSAAGWRDRLVALANAYLALLARSGELLRYLSTRQEAVELPARTFDAYFKVAVEPLTMPDPVYEAARGALVDFIHGFSLALQGRGSAKSRRDFKAELDVVLAGIEASVSGRPAREQRHR